MDMDQTNIQKLAQAKKEISLFGKGEEKRDHVFLLPTFIF